jgi:Fur family iron response transcriptional regulator
MIESLTSHQCRAMTDLDSAGRVEAWLESAGLRPTRQRRTLAALLIGDGRHRHVTAEILHAAARDAGEAVALATVYNTLKCFTEAGLLAEITVDGARSYFDTRTEDHPHFFWEDEGVLTDAPVDSVEIARLPEPPEGAEISRVDVVVRLRRV